MFICLRPCFDKECETLNEKCLICDTEDLTLEYVSIDDISEYFDESKATLVGQPVALNKDNRYGFQYICTFETALQLVRRESLFLIHTERIFRLDCNNWCIDNTVIRFVSEYNYFVVNDIRVSRDDDVYKRYTSGYILNYAFQFRDYIVFRICYNTMDVSILVDTIVLSVAVRCGTQEVACIWDDVHGILYEKVNELYTKIDTLCNY